MLSANTGIFLSSAPCKSPNFILSSSQQALLCCLPRPPTCGNAMESTHRIAQVCPARRSMSVCMRQAGGRGCAQGGGSGGGGGRAAAGGAARGAGNGGAAQGRAQRAEQPQRRHSGAHGRAQGHPRHPRPPRCVHAAASVIELSLGRPVHYHEQLPVSEFCSVDPSLPAAAGEEAVVHKAV